jgi:hypothetical protein
MIVAPDQQRRPPADVVHRLDSRTLRQPLDGEYRNATGHERGRDHDGLVEQRLDVLVRHDADDGCRKERDEDRRRETKGGWLAAEGP